MSLQLDPEVANAVRQYAEREGVFPEELLRRAFPIAAPVFSVQTLLRHWQQEYGLPPRPDGLVHTSAHDLFVQWDAEDAHLTEVGTVANQQLCEDYQKQARSRVALSSVGRPT